MTQCIKTESVINKRSSRVLFIPILSLQNFSLSQFQYGIRASWLGVLHRFLTHPPLLGFFLEDFSLCNFFPLSSISFFQSFFNSLLSLILENKFPVKPSSSFFNGFRIYQYRFCIICFSNFCGCLGKTVQSLFFAQ